MVKRYRLIRLLLATLTIPCAHLHSNNKPKTQNVEKKEQKKISVWTKLGLAGAAVGTAAIIAFGYLFYPQTTLTKDERKVLNSELELIIQKHDRAVDKIVNGTFRNVSDVHNNINLTNEEIIELSNIADKHARNFIKKQPEYEKYSEKVVNCKAETLIECIDKVVTPFAPDLALFMKKDVYNQWLNFYHEIEIRSIAQIRAEYLAPTRQ